MTIQVSQSSAIPSRPIQVLSGYKVNTMVTYISAAKKLNGNIFVVNRDKHVFKIEFYVGGVASPRVILRKDGAIQKQGATIPVDGLVLENDFRIARNDQYLIDFSINTENIAIIQHYLQRI